MKHTIQYLLICFLFAISFMGILTGCNKKEEPSKTAPKESNIPVESSTPEPSVAPVSSPSAIETEAPVEETHEGEVHSRLTGLWIPEKEANYRPYAVIINNISLANPHSGLGQASIIYEAVVEGGITRMLALFENFDAEKIGSVRSARHYFVSFADEYDAIFVHFGHTSYALNKISELGIDNISGLSGIGDIAFYRDYNIRAPHNAFASKNGLKKAAKELGYRLKYEKDYKDHFSFHETDTVPEKGKTANRVDVVYSSAATPYFIYDDNDGLYYRYQFGDKHIDITTKEQLSFKNVIIMYVEQWNIDNNGYQTMKIEEATGTGHYITNGKAVDITWEKSESARSCTFYHGKEELVLNPGKTFICVVPDRSGSSVTFHKKKK